MCEYLPKVLCAERTRPCQVRQLWSEAVEADASGEEVLGEPVATAEAENVVHIFNLAARLGYEESSESEQVGHPQGLEQGWLQVAAEASGACLQQGGEEDAVVIRKGRLADE